MSHVLYAEDEDAVARFMGDLFEANAPGFTLEIVKTGVACLERMKQGGVDVLLLDLKLPDIDGLQVLGDLAIAGDSTPVVMVSGHGQTELAVKALRAGAVDCVDKASPQFLQIVEIVKRLDARRQREPAGAPRAAKPVRRHSVVLIEGSEATYRGIEEAFSAISPQIDLRVLAFPLLPDDIASGPDAVLIGPDPGGKPLDILRIIRSRAPELPVILIVPGSVDSETAVAAFKLGAQDYIIQNPSYVTELIFSLRHILNRSDLSRRNDQLSRELEAMNRSLEAQVEARTSELEALSMRFISVREDERRTIARELHDDFGQLLTGLMFQLETATHGEGPPAKARLAEALSTATDLMKRTRDITLRLRPLVLDDLGLKPAIEWHLNLFQQQTGIAVESEISLPEDRLAGGLEMTIFRIVQEALTNVARHAGCRTAHVMITCRDRLVTVEIADRGGGFDLEAVRAKRNSLGLVGLAERARLAGGVMEITSRPGRGTRVLATFPMPVAPKTP
jgi:signal transduction histidine kinase